MPTVSPSKPQRKGKRILFQTLWAVGGLIVLLSVIDFVAFTQRVSRLRAPEDMPRADAVVVLTGGAGRIAIGVDLVRAGHGERLLVTGTNPQTTLADLEASQGGAPEVYRCCVDLGSDARTTIGNGTETAAWARARGFRQVIVVTSDWHMPRSMIELERSMPEAEFLPYPVRTKPDPTKTWNDPDVFRAMLYEWSKYRITAFLRTRPRPEAQGD